MSGWVKLHRKITDWEWWDDHSTTRLFIYLITRANHKDKKWRGIEIKRGQLLTSLDKLSKKTGVSMQKVRTGIKRLKSTHEITSQATSTYTIFTVEKYDLYQYEQQESNTPNNKPLTNQQHTDNMRVTTNNNDKKKKNEKNVKKTTDLAKPNGQMSLIQYFGKGFKGYFGNEYHANFAKDGKLLQLLANQYGKERVIKGIEYFFNTYLIQDQFAMDNPNVGTFSVKWNSMIALSSGKKALTNQQKKMQNKINNIMEVDLD